MVLTDATQPRSVTGNAPGQTAKLPLASRNKWRKLRSSYMRSATIHGLSKALTGRGMERIFWSVAICCSIGVVLAVTCTSVRGYLEHRKYSQMITVPAQSMKLPSVTLCNPWRVGEMDDDVTPTYFSKGFQEFARGHPRFCKDSSNKPCFLESDFVGMREEHACITFNANATHVQRLPGPNYAIEIVVYVNMSDVGNNALFQSIRAGLSITIHNPDEFPMFWFESFFVPSGMSTHISLSKTETSRLPFGASTCTDGNASKLNGNLSIFPGRYSASHCYASCFFIFANLKCGYRFRGWERYVPGNRSWSGQNVSIQQQECIAHLIKDFTQVNESTCNCHVACQETKYSHASIPLRWPRHHERVELKETFSKTFNYTISDQEIDESIYHIKVYYPKLEYTLIEEKAAYPLDQVLSDLSGQLGLATGASLLSAIELIVIILSTMLAVWK